MQKLFVLSIPFHVKFAPRQRAAATLKRVGARSKCGCGIAGGAVRTPSEPSEDAEAVEDDVSTAAEDVQGSANHRKSAQDNIVAQIVAKVVLRCRRCGQCYPAAQGGLVVSPVKCHRGRKGEDHLREEPNKMRVGRALNVQIAAANVIKAAGGKITCAMSRKECV